MRAVVALGGNMILEKGQTPSIATQQRNILKSLKCLIPLFKKRAIVITHGNGPQVGNIMIRSELAKKKAYPIPLDVGVAQSEGELGYLIANGLSTILRAANLKRSILSLLTHVEVNAKDPAMKNPTKPVGPYLSVISAKKLKREGKAVAKTAKGWRRVVPSPIPKKILENEILKKIISKKAITIAGGGGGIPVIKKGKKHVGIEAVIDKDLTSALLAQSIRADLLIFLTNVPNIYINYKKENQERLGIVSKKEISKYQKQGQFPPGSMGPKVQAALQFLKKGKKVIITNPSTLSQSLQNKGGTIIR